MRRTTRRSSRVPTRAVTGTSVRLARAWPEKNGRFLLGPTRPGWARGPNCGSGAPDVQNENFSLLNWLKLDHSVMWPNFNELGCFLTNCSKWGVRQQMTITLDVRQTIFPFYNGVHDQLMNITILSLQQVALVWINIPIRH